MTALTGGCDDDATAPGCPDCALVAEVRGTVRTDVGDVVSGAAVRLVPLRTGASTCEALTPPGETSEATTGADGSFSVAVRAQRADEPACVEISVAPLQGSHLAAEVDTVDATFVEEGEPPRPSQIALELHGDRFIEVSVGGLYTTCGLRSDGVVECWGENRYGEGSARRKASAGRFTQVSQGGVYACGVRDDGAVECWGDLASALRPTASGCLQCPDTTTLVITGPFGDLDGFRQVDAGGSGVCMLLAKGVAKCTGDFMVAAGSHEAREGAFTVVHTNGVNFCGLRDDGAVECFPDGSAVGTGVHTADIGSYVDMDTSGSPTCGVRTDGAVECFSFTPPQRKLGLATEVRTATSGSFRQVAPAFVVSGHVCALRDDGAVECWGANDFGQAPPLVTATEGSFTQVSTTTWHTCALRDDGAVECWGRNDRGQAPPLRRVGER